ncbi:hypothetical protein WI44_04365 [Burkholderia cepacia]|uniref:tail fiber domain-containing protein n=1 Tax=Burkholderia cepacia TaxID=292 RepID=UPI000759DB82|nr:tail fiber domain-containing protein [Burkholderia cepacia]KVA25083.1 hypothetical protein WI44_04365 [Burkholderia cepacia]KVA45574.1 hypothetical protein WI45_12155 [Burkholderia cepacia]
MPVLQKANLGVAPSGAGGDDQRTANVRFNANFDAIAARVPLEYSYLADTATLLPSHAGFRFGLSMPGPGKVVTLPLASSVPVNGCIHLYNEGPPVRVGLQGSDGTQITLLNTGDWAKYVGDGGAYWHVAERGRLMWDETVGGNLVVGGTLNVPGGVAGDLAASGRLVGVNSSNLLLNGTGELGDTGWNGSSFGWSNGAVGEGRQFINASAINTGTWVVDASADIPCGPNVPLVLSGEISTTGLNAGQAYMKCEAFKSDGAYIGNLCSTTPISSKQNYSFQKSVGTTPAGTAFVRVSKVADNGPNISQWGVAFRRIKLEKGIAPSLYSQEASIAYLGGAPMFSGVPKFGQYVPWHSGNLNPASLVSDQTFKGTNIFEKSILSSFAPADYGSILVATRAVGYAFNDWGKSSAVVRVECDNNQAAYQIVHAQKTGQRDLFAMTVYAGGSANSNPMASFTFTGTVNAHQFYDGGNAVFVGSLSQGSDYRIKTLVENIDPAAAYDGVRRLRFVDYLKTTNVGEDAERRIAGVIAHEAQEVFSNVVSGEKDAVEDDGRLKLQTVDYNGLGVYVGAAVQHMANLIESLTSDVVKLRAEVAMLRGGR